MTLKMGTFIASPIVALLASALALTAPAHAERMDSYRIKSHGTASITYPDWFKQSFLDLREDLAEARAAGRRGLIVFFSQKNCNHCQAFLDTTLGDPAIRQRVQDNYDIVALDIFNDIEITDVAGARIAIRDFAQREKARFTPTLLFYTADSAPALRIIGFYPPEKFTRVLDYVDGDHYRRMSLGEYLTPVDASTASGGTALAVDHTLFAHPPHDLRPGSDPRPLLVLFDQAGCSACERFHDRVLGDARVRALLGKYRAVQLDRRDAMTGLVTPQGRQTTARAWAHELGLAYEPSALFFDAAGNEVHRIDAEAGTDRFTGSLEYVLEGAYAEHPQFLRWRREKARAQ